MIGFTEIATLIEDPNLVSPEVLDDLSELANRYPFSAVFSQLYLKGLAVHDAVQFDAALKEHAYRVPDRSQLFFIVHAAETSNVALTSSTTEEKRTITNEENKVAPEIENAEGIDKSEDDKNDFVETKKNKTIEEEQPIDQGETDYTVTSSDKEKESVQEETNSALKGEKEEKNNKETEDGLERDILAHAVSSSISLEVDEESEETYSFSRLKQLDENQTNQESVSSINFDISTSEDKEEEDNENRKSEIHSNGKRTFTSWMNNFIDQEGRKEQNIVEKTTKKGKVTAKKEKNKEKSTTNLQQNEFFSPVKKAKESLNESRLPVSETLAKIYALQGNYPKAIEAYQKLLLKFPEKKSFFALQIESLKRKLN